MNWNELAQWLALIWIYFLLAAHRHMLHPNAPTYSDLRRKR